MEQLDEDDDENLYNIFKQIFEVNLHLPLLATIVVLTVAIGDGLAEPVGIYLGKKKYVVPSWNMKNRYIRSYVGSACVYLFAILFLILKFLFFKRIAIQFNVEKEVFVKSSIFKSSILIIYLFA